MSLPMARPGDIPLTRRRAVDFLRVTRAACRWGPRIRLPHPEPLLVQAGVDGQDLRVVGGRVVVVG
ncbi:hypothetical protein, partial [Nocardia farcinica]|uniref:hypothetical protein n=1 Tax=Nocardia farcinica TaxID=37329 RepID=UPI0024586DC5